jgi:hypothetical protein
MISFIYIYILKKISGVAVTPIWAKGVAQGTISDTYSNHRGAHHEIYKTTWVYIGKKKLCLSNKTFGHFFWVISIGQICNFVFPIVTHH